MDKLASHKIIWLITLVSAAEAALVWNTKGEVALFISIAVPIDVYDRHVFLSYNFEASYHLPKTWRRRPPILRRGNGTHVGAYNNKLDDFDEYEYEYEYEETQHHKRKKPKPPRRKKPKPGQHNKPPKPPKHPKKKKPKPKPKPPTEDYKDFFEDSLARRRREQTLLSRSKFYELLSHRFEQHGFGTGDDCLLRLICEANSAELGEHNGVLGSLIHVLFSPSSSHDEGLPQSYYTAELKGRQNDCIEYSGKCERSFLELITRPLEDYIQNKRLSFQ